MLLFFVLFKFIRKNKIQISKYAVVGSFASLCNFVAYSTLVRFNINISFSSALAYFVGFLISFIFSKNWVFNKNSLKRINHTFLNFLLIYTLGGIGMTLIINFVFFSINNYEIAWALGVSYSATNNYLGSKYFVFND